MYALAFLILRFQSQYRMKRKKITKIFIFTLPCDGSRGFMKSLKAFTKPFEVLQRSAKIKIYVDLYFNTIF